MADVIFETHFCQKGLPDNFVTDRGSLFTSQYFSSLCYYLSVRCRYSTAFHPQTDGQTERQNQTLEQYLRSYINYQQDDWVKWLPLAEFAYNNSFHQTIGGTPFFMEYGYHPKMEEEIQPGISRDVPSALDRAVGLLAMRRYLEANWKATVNKQYNQKHTPRTFKVGDKVWLNAKNIRTVRPSKKLDYKYFGPFQILDVVGKQAYRLQLPSTFRGVHNVFHVSLLEEYKTTADREEAKPPPIEVDGQDAYEIEEILDSKVRYGKLSYLVKWLGYPNSDDTWIRVTELTNV